MQDELAAKLGAKRPTLEQSMEVGGSDEEAWQSDEPAQPVKKKKKKKTKKKTKKSKVIKKSTGMFRICSECVWYV